MSKLISPTHTAPGVYVTELPAGQHAIPSPRVGVAAFIGAVGQGRPFTPTTLNSLGEFEQQFGGTASPNNASLYLTSAVQAFFLNGGERLVVVRAVDPMTALPARGTVTPTLSFVAASVGAWANGLNVELDLDQEDTVRVSVVEISDDGSRVVLETFPTLSLGADSPRSLTAVLARDSEFVRVADASTVTGGPVDLGVVAGSTLTVTLSSGVDGDADSAVSEAALTTAVGTLKQHPDVSLMAVPGVTDVSDLTGVVAEVIRRDDVLLVLDAPKLTDRTRAVVLLQAYRSAFGHQANLALYAPWVRIDGPTGPQHVPPSGFIAGVIARTDLQRGVFHTPAGLGAYLQGADGLLMTLDDTEQAPLNDVGVNVIRTFPDAGVVAWGAKTLSTLDDGTQHIPVRRTVEYVSKAVREGTAWVVLEENTQELRERVTQSVNAFMNDLFRQGAFAGAVPTDAYRVTCDADNNPQDKVDRGILTITVQFAMFKVGAFQTVEIEHERV